MRRALVITLAIGLLAAPAASAKVSVEEARACGARDCRTVAAASGSLLAFELLGPTIEAGRRTAAPLGADAESHYRVTLRTRPGGDAVRLDYLPGPNYIRVHGQPGEEAGGALLNRGWVRLGPGVAYAYAERASEIEAYRELVEGLSPLPGADSAAGPDRRGVVRGAWLALGAGGLAIGLAVLRRAVRRPR